MYYVAIFFSVVFSEQIFKSKRHTKWNESIIMMTAGGKEENEEKLGKCTLILYEYFFLMVRIPIYMVVNTIYFFIDGSAA